MLTNSAHFSQLNDVAAFVTVVKVGSFTAAAEKLNTSKSVISKYVSRLETRLGVKLLIRSTRKLTLTEIGEVFFEGAVKGIESIEEAENAVSVLQGSPKGSLKINAPLSFGTCHLAPLIGRFLKRYPEVEVDMTLDDRQLDMIGEGFDITLRITNEIEGHFFARRLATCQHAIVASPQYIKENGAPKQPEQLNQHQLITFPYQHSPWEWEFKKHSQQSKWVTIDTSIRMNNSLAIKNAVLNHVGIARMPTFLVGQDIKEGRLISLFPNHQLLELSIYLVFSNRINMAPKIRAFIDFMTESFKDKLPWD